MESTVHLAARYLILLICAAGGLTGAAVTGEQTSMTKATKLIPREVLFGNPDKRAPCLSPDGKQLAYLAPDGKGVMNVWVRTLGKYDDRVVTADKKRGIRGFFWQADNRHILYMQDQDGDENWHVYQTDLATSNTRDLTPFQGVQARVQDVNHDFPDRILVGLNLLDRRLHDVYSVDLRNGAVELDTRNPGDVAGWSTDNRMRVRAAETVTSDGGTLIRVRRDANSPWRKFQRWGADESGSGVLGFTPDNRGVWLSTSLQANAARLVRVDLATSRATTIAEDAKHDLGGIITDPRTHKLEAVRFVRDRREWKIVDPSIKPDFDAISKVRDGDFDIASRDHADRKWIVAYTMDDGPAYYYLYERATRRSTLLFSNRPALEKHSLSKMQPVSFPARDGLELHGYLSLPVGAAPKGLPTVLFVHGGPWGRDVWGLSNDVQWLTNRGFAVLQINFRGSTGYGKRHLNAGDREWGAKMHDDLIDAKNWAVREGYADPKRVVIYGGSYGGYAALAGATFTPDEFAAAVSVVGPSSLVTLIQTIPPYWAPVRAQFDKRVGNLDTDRAFLESRSPLHKADRIRIPLLVAQGANDPRVKQAESDQIVAAARKNGREVEYLVFPDEGHGFARPENRLKFYAAMESFLARHFGTPAEPPSEKEKWDDLKK
jgi:dipeptidyl aminopeptidase/acylaminoacyl peptidase